MGLTIGTACIVNSTEEWLAVLGPSLEKLRDSGIDQHMKIFTRQDGAQIHRRRAASDTICDGPLNPA